jgi:hypothetical protein
VLQAETATAPVMTAMVMSFRIIIFPLLSLRL